MSLQNQDPPNAPKVKRAKPKSRSARWGDAVSELQNCFIQMDEVISRIEEAASDLRSVQEEYEEWKDNLPENLQSSALGEKLEEVCNLEIENLADNLRSAYDDAMGIVEEAEGIDLPQGFGRD